MKVLQVIDSGGLYGAERVLLALMDALRDDGVETALASIAEPGLAEKPLEIEAKKRGHDVRRVTMAAGPDRRAARALALQARNEGFDVLHTHGYKANTLLAGMPRRRRGLPAVATLHGWTAPSLLTRMGLYEAAERLALRRVDRVVAVSQAMVERWGLDRRYGNRLSVIPNGIPAPPAGSAERRLPEEIAEFIAGRSAIFAAGRLSREKGFDILLEALAGVRRRGLDACLVLCGEGDERKALEAQAARLGISAAVRLPGYLESVAALMRHFQVVAIPSRTEGLPVTLLEALMAGVPVAATEVGEMPAVVEECGAGRCVAADDVQALADALGTALSQAADPAHRKAVSLRAAAAYSSTAMARAYRASYIRLERAL